MGIIRHRRRTIEPAPPLRDATTIPGGKISGSIYHAAPPRPLRPPPHAPRWWCAVSPCRARPPRHRSTLRAPPPRTLHPRQHRRRHAPGDTLNRGQPPTIEGEPLGSFLRGACPRTGRDKGKRPNAIHGQRRTNADKRRCVELAVKEFASLSSRAIAELCGVSKTFVENIRPDASATVANATRTTSDGRQYPAKRKSR